MSDEKLLMNLRLARTEQVGPVTYQRLIQTYGNAEDALAALPELAKRGGRRGRLKPMSMGDAKKELAATQKQGGTYIIWGEPPYPAHLAALPDAPPVLGVFGHVHLLDRQNVAIVGSRNASVAGVRLAHILAEGLGARQYVIGSGLARGIDSAAHKAAIESGTMAVLGNGINHFYPKENETLQSQIMQQGLILCENPPDTPPQGTLFPRRNRIIAGLSLGVIVVEAARKSGSLITAHLAGEYGREVMAVPGSPLDARCLGSNNLIRDGATLVESVDDVLAILSPYGNMETNYREIIPSKVPPPDISPDQREQIIASMGAVPVTIDDIVQSSGASVPQVSLVVLELDLAGRLTQEAGGLLSLSQ